METDRGPSPLLREEERQVKGQIGVYILLREEERQVKGLTGVYILLSAEVEGEYIPFWSGVYIFTPTLGEIWKGALSTF